MRIFSSFFLFCIAVVGIIFFLSLPPRDFPDSYILTVENGDSVHSIAQKLSAAHTIQSQTVFIIYARIFGNERDIHPGEYLFSGPTPTYKIALRIVGSDFGIEKKKLTIPEGSTNAQIAKDVVALFPNISYDNFLQALQGKEGYLFPDTYSFFPSVTQTDIIDALEKNFSYKISFFDARIKQSGHSELEVLTMASLIEKEAFGDVDRATISGILWKRLDAKMPLQVDAATRFDNSYDTYTNVGLPPLPINNPGSKALDAALSPKNSQFWYYLHDKNGGVHYAVSFAEHKKNIQTYLK